MIEVENTKSIQIIRRKYEEIRSKIIERYKIDMSVYLNIENKVELIRKRVLNNIVK